MRNKMIHEYANIDLDVVFDTVKDDLPALKEQIAPLLAQERAGQRQAQESPETTQEQTDSPEQQRLKHQATIDERRAFEEQWYRDHRPEPEREPEQER